MAKMLGTASVRCVPSIVDDAIQVSLFEAWSYHRFVLGATCPVWSTWGKVQSARRLRLTVNTRSLAHLQSAVGGNTGVEATQHMPRVDIRNQCRNTEVQDLVPTERDQTMSLGDVPNAVEPWRASCLCVLPSVQVRGRWWK
jgi:hypothetical protein